MSKESRSTRNTESRAGVMGLCIWQFLQISFNWSPQSNSYFCWYLFCLFSKAEKREDGKIACTLRVHWGEFVGKGVNMRIAKATAAKLAMEALEKKTTSQASVLENEQDWSTMQELKSWRSTGCGRHQSQSAVGIKDGLANIHKPDFLRGVFL